MTFDILRIYDSETTIDLLGKDGTPGFKYLGWSPSLATPKGGGVRASSPTGWGSRVVFKAWENIVDTLTLQVEGSTTDEKIEFLQDLRRLLEKGESYWRNNWQTDPVVIECRGSCETNSRYALVKSYQTPSDSDPFVQPFNVDEGLVLTIEHTFWYDTPPFTPACLETGASQIRFNYRELTTVPTDSADDAYVNTGGGGLIFTGLPDLIVGGSTGDQYHTGIRFRNNTIPPGATIINAWITLKATVVSADGGDTAVTVRGELNATPSIFSTYANFMGRTLTSASKEFTLPTLTAGDKVILGGLEGIIQEIVNLGGWASGNNLVLFIRDSGISPVVKRFAALEHISYAEPTLTVEYITSQRLFGSTPSCTEGSAIISNFHRQSQLTHLFYFDGVGYSANLINTYPTALLPTVPAIGHVLYIMTENGESGGAHFPNVIFNLIPGTQLSGVWEFSRGGGLWANLGANAPYTDTTSQLQSPGICGVYFSTANMTGAGGVWAQDTINGVTGYALRFRVTAVGGTPTAPVQQLGRVYSAIWPNTNIPGESIKGDIPCRVRTQIVPQRTILDTKGALAEAELQNHRVIMGTRSKIRGEYFQMCLNAQEPPGSNPDNPFIYPVYTGSGWTPNNPDLYSPVNKSLTWSPAGPSSGTLYWRILPPVMPSFIGRYRVFMRLKNGGAASNNTLQLFTGTTYDLLGNTLDQIYYYAEVKTIYPVGTTYQLVELGVCDLPPAPVERPGSSPQGIIVGVSIINGSGAPALTFYDLILVPVDEFSFEIHSPQRVSPLNRYGSLGLVSSGTPFIYSYAQADSIWTKQSILASLFSTVDNELLYKWRGISPLFNGLQSNSDQEQYFLVSKYLGDYWVAYPFYPSSIQNWALYQYLSMRGNR